LALCADIRMLNLFTLLGARHFSSEVKNVGIIGLGNMGGHMARNLIKNVSKMFTIGNRLLEVLCNAIPDRRIRRFYERKTVSIWRFRLTPTHS